MNNKPKNLKEELRGLLKRRRNCLRVDCAIDHKLPPNELIDQILTTISKHLPEKRVVRKKVAGSDIFVDGFNQCLDEVNKLLTTNKKEEA